MRPSDLVSDIREFERWLHQRGWSRRDALALASGGWPAMRRARAGVTRYDHATARPTPLDDRSATDQA